jgi:hypothetical protein
MISEKKRNSYIFLIKFETKRNTNPMNPPTIETESIKLKVLLSVVVTFLSMKKLRVINDYSGLVLSAVATRP